MLMLSDLVEGTYKYTLTIVNTQHVSASDGVTIQVFPDPLDDYLIQVHLEGEISAFSVTKQVSESVEKPQGLFKNTVEPLKRPAILSFVERLSSFRGDFLYSVYTRVLSACPLLGGLSSF